MFPPPTAGRRAPRTMSAPRPSFGVPAAPVAPIAPAGPAVPVALTALALASLLGACSEDGGTTLGRFSVDEDLPATRVQGAGPVAGGVLPTVLPSLPLDIESTGEYDAAEYDFITGIAIDALSLSVKLPESQDADTDRFEDGMTDDLSFLSELELYIVATFDDEQQEALLGSLPENDPALDPDRAATTLDLDMTGVNILDYVEAEGGYEVRIEVNGTLPPDDVIFDGEVTYDVRVGFN